MKRTIHLAALVAVSFALSGCASLKWRMEGTIPPPEGTPPAPPPPPAPAVRALMTKDEAIARSREYVFGRGYHHSKIEDIDVEDGGRTLEVELRLHGRTKGEIELVYDRESHQLIAVDEDIERHKGDDDRDGPGKHGKGKGKGHDKHAKNDD